LAPVLLVAAGLMSVMPLKSSEALLLAPTARRVRLEAVRPELLVLEQLCRRVSTAHDHLGDLVSQGQAAVAVREKDKSALHRQGDRYVVLEPRIVPSVPDRTAY
jgi:hypothetical protein